MASQLLWFFDLDNTLHDASHAIFPAIHYNMSRYIGDVLREQGLPHDAVAVEAARQGYWQRYGATLLGMVRHHQVKVDDFLSAAHRFDDLSSMIRAERGLAALLKRLPGRKILLTNAPSRYARDVLRHLGLHRHFGKQIAIESMRVHGRLQPKPSKALLRKLLAAERVPASRCILVEDTVSALRAAKSLGMRTVWITGYMPKQSADRSAEHAAKTKIGHPVCVDVRLRNVGQIPLHLFRLR